MTTDAVWTRFVRCWKRIAMFYYDSVRREDCFGNPTRQPEVL